jgi:hypothetical protein
MRILSPIVEFKQSTILVGTTVLDSVNVDEYGSVDWIVCISNPNTGARYRVTISAAHNGTLSADATDGSFQPVGGAVIGVVDVVLSIDLNGAGASQVMRLIATTSTANWTAQVHRSPLVGG